MTHLQALLLMRYRRGRSHGRTQKRVRLRHQPATPPAKSVIGWHHGAGAEWMEARIRAEVAERALEHEAARNRQLQAAMADLERRLGEALATAPATPPKLTDETLERLEQTFETVTRLEGAASALAGTERFLRLQNDAVRQQTQNEADQLRQRIRTLEAEVTQLRTQIDAYRRAPERAAPVSRGWVKPSS